MGTVKHKFTGDAKQLEAELERIQRKLVKLEEKNQDLANKSKKANSAHGRMADSIGRATQRGIQNVKQMVTGYVGLQAAVAAVNASIMLQNRLSEEAKQKSVTIADAQASVVKNIGDVDGKTIQSFFSKVSGIKQASGFQSEKALLDAAASILSGTGGDQKKTLEILRNAAPLFRDQQEELATFGGALADLMKNSDLKDAKKATAFALAIQGQARFEDLGGFKNVAPALAATNIATGGDVLEGARRGAALFAAFGSEGGDVDGTLTKGAVTALAAGLERAAPQFETFDERLAFVRKNEEAQNTVLEKGFRGAMLLLARDFIRDKKSNIAQTYSRALKEIRPDERAVDRKIDQLNNLTPELRTAASQRRFEGEIEAFDLGNSRRAQVKAIFDQTIDRTNKGLLASADNFIRRRRLEFAGGDVDDAIAILESRRTQILRDTLSPLYDSKADQTKMIDLINTAIAELKRIGNNSQPRPTPGRNEEGD